MEGLVVDKTITLCDLKGMLEVLVQKIFGEGTTTRLRPSYFPFTEPSVEVDDAAVYRRTCRILRICYDCSQRTDFENTGKRNQ